MDARHHTKRPLLRAAAFAASLAVGGASFADEAIRLPAWVEPGEAAAKPASLLEQAPRPPRLGEENDLGMLLETPAASSLVIEQDDVWRALNTNRESDAATSVPPPTDVESSRSSDSPGDSPSPREPRAFVAPGRLAVSQLEHAAETARTAHTLSRLIRRYEKTREQLTESADATLRARTDRVGGWAYESRGRLAAQRGEHERAVNDFRRALAVDSTNRSARQSLAISLAETGDKPGALRLLDRVLDEAPAAPEALRNRAAIHLALGDAEAAVVDCDAALPLLAAEHPDRGAALRLRGVALHAVGRLREAAVDLNEAIRLNPSDADALVARGHVFAEGGFYEQAISDYADAAHADPGHAEAYRSLAWSLATCPEKRLRDPALAVESAWRARRLGDAEDPLTLDASAAAHAAAGDFSEAIRLAQQLLMTAGDAAPTGARQRLRLYQAGRPYVSR